MPSEPLGILRSLAGKPVKKYASIQHFGVDSLDLTVVWMR
jgi:hypothetical protein